MAKLLGDVLVHPDNVFVSAATSALFAYLTVLKSVTLSYSEAVASAMHCFWRSPDDYRRTVLTAVNTDGDSDSIATIAGSISGARLGIDAIPERWRSGVEDSDCLHQLGRRLWEGRCTS